MFAYNGDGRVAGAYQLSEVGEILVHIPAGRSLNVENGSPPIP